MAAHGKSRQQHASLELSASSSATMGEARGAAGEAIPLQHELHTNGSTAVGTSSNGERNGHATLELPEHAGPMPRRVIAFAGFLICAWYALSTALSLFNKFTIGHKYGVLNGEPFPAPMLMSAAQFALQYALARAVHGCGVRRTLAEAPSWGVWRVTVLPNGVATGLDICFSNTSFAFITLSFYTMCKSSSPLFLLIFAFLWGIEKPTWPLGATVLIISAGLLLLAAGEVHFDPLGFFLVMTASCMAGLRWTLTQVLLQGGEAGAGKRAVRGTALEVLEQVTPVMAATSALASLAFEPLLTALHTSVYFSSLAHAALTASLVAASAVIAFLMVWTEFALIATTSALTFMVAGVFKEIVTVLFAHAVFGDTFTPLNVVGLAVLISGVCLFNYQRYRKVRAEAMGARAGGGDPAHTAAE